MQNEDLPRTNEKFKVRYILQSNYHLKFYEIDRLFQIRGPRRFERKPGGTFLAFTTVQTFDKEDTVINEEEFGSLSLDACWLFSYIFSRSISSYKFCLSSM